MIPGGSWRVIFPFFGVRPAWLADAQRVDLGGTILVARYDLGGTKEQSISYPLVI